MAAKFFVVIILPLLAAITQAGIHLCKQPRLIVSPSPLHDRLKELTMSHALHNWIFIGANSYVEYTFVSWLDRNVYRRTVDLRQVCLQ
jgi:hypothetical protein